MVNDAKGGTVYRDHLPLLGEQGQGRSAGHGWSIGDQVRLTGDRWWCAVRTRVGMETADYGGRCVHVSMYRERVRY